MTATTERPRILTDNEKYVSGFLDEEAAGGVWMVSSPIWQPIVNAMFSNRKAAEDYIYDKCEIDARLPEYYTLSVWAVHEGWPPEDEDGDVA